MTAASSWEDSREASGPCWSQDADDEGFAGGVDDFLGDGGHLVDLQDAFDLRGEAAGEAEVAAGDAGDRGQGLGGGEVVGVVQAEVRPVPGQDKRLFPRLRAAGSGGRTRPGCRAGGSGPGAFRCRACR